MDIALSELQLEIDASVRKVCAQFDDAYWHECDESARFPEEFYAAMAGAGWLGITMPQELGGAGLGVTEAAIMMHAVSSSGGAQAAASSIHINLFGPHAIVVHGTAEQKQRWLTPLIKGEEKACFGVTEPDAGLDTTSMKTFAKKVPGGYRVSGRKMWTSTGQEAHKIVLLARTTPKSECKRPTDGMTLFYADLDRKKIDVRRIKKLGRNAVDSNATFIDDYFIPDADRIGDEGRGFHYVLDSLNPERVLVGIEAIGIGRDALQRAAKYARERVVFGRPIGQNQGIQHPLAESWTFLESAYWMCMRAAYLYDQGQPCAAEAKKHRIRYADPRLDNAFDITLEAVAPAMVLSSGMHLEQAMKTRGWLKLRGKEYPVNGFTVRDRSWGSCARRVISRFRRWPG